MRAPSRKTKARGGDFGAEAARAPARPRLKRDAPRRSGPIRDMSRAFRTPDPPPGVGPEAPGEATEGAAEQGVVESAVATAYKVFEEYMQRGRQAAYRQKRADESGGAMRSDRIDPASMAMRYWVEMWQAFMAPFMPGGMPGMGMPGMGMPGAGTPGMGMPGTQPPAVAWMPGMPGIPSAGGPPGGVPGVPPPGPSWQIGHREGAHKHEQFAVAVEVTSAKPAKVKVTLHDRSVKHFAAHDLQAAGGEGRLSHTHVKLHLHDETLSVSLSIPADQAVGIYSGVITEKHTGKACGTLEVTISAPST